MKNEPTIFLQLAPADHEITLPADIAPGEYRLEFRLGGEKYPTVRFATDTSVSDDRHHFLSTLAVE